MSERRYWEARLPPAATAEEPLCLMARLAGSGLFQQYVVYENGGEWAIGGGVLSSLRLDRTARDLRAVERWLASVPVRDWRVYGWAAFELGAALGGVERAGGGGEGGSDGLLADPLLHLVVPVDEVRAELRADGSTVLVRSMDPERLERLVRFVREGGHRPPPTVPRPREHVGLALEDTGNYRAAVAAALVELRAAGTPLDKVILSRTLPVPVPLDLAATYVAGRRANTPARSFLLDLGGVRAAGFSPETVVEVSGRRVVTRPLAGTRARTGSADDDARLRAELVADPKEVHEHAISVKLALEDLAAVCDDTHVVEYMTVQERGSVQHLASTVVGHLRIGYGPWEAFAALFPAVTATGIPKAAAYPLIRGLEGRPRGLYGGAVLTFDADGTLDAALVLRSVFEREGRCWLQAGAGIVRQSQPEREHEETCEKLASVARHLVAGARRTEGGSGVPEPRVGSDREGSDREGRRPDTCTRPGAADPAEG